MVSMTYGVMPPREDFDAAFDREVPNRFRFGNDPRVGNCELTADELWSELESAKGEHDDGDDEAGDWASCVLYTLGFEWI
jgi:hypothetical protein